MSEEYNPYTAPRSDDAAVLPSKVHDGGFVDAAVLTRVVSGLLILFALATLVSFFSEMAEYILLSNIQQNKLADEVLMVAAERNDARQQIVESIRLTMFWVSGIPILMWIYRANRNARALGAHNMTVSPAWSVGSFFVPIANLFIPYRAMKEIWQASRRPDDWRTGDKTSILLPAWWTFWLLNGFAVSIANQIVKKSDEIEPLLNASMLYQSAYAFMVIESVILWHLIRKIYHFQVTSANLKNIQ